MDKVIRYTCTTTNEADVLAAKELLSQIKVLSGILFRLLDREADHLISDDVDLDAAWSAMQDLWDASYVMQDLLDESRYVDVT